MTLFSCGSMYVKCLRPKHFLMSSTFKWQGKYRQESQEASSHFSAAAFNERTSGVLRSLKSSKAPTNYFTPNILRKSWSRLVVSVVHLDALAVPVAAM